MLHPTGGGLAHESVVEKCLCCRRGILEKGTVSVNFGGKRDLSTFDNPKVRMEIDFGVLQDRNKWVEKVREWSLNTGAAIPFPLPNVPPSNCTKVNQSAPVSVLRRIFGHLINLLNVPSAAFSEAISLSV
jgi:hypothetical protein